MHAHSLLPGIVHNDEFSSRLSMNSVIRLRGAAIKALTKDTSPNSTKVSKLVSGFTSNKRHDEQHAVVRCASSGALQTVSDAKQSNGQIHGKSVMHTVRGGVFLFGQAISCLVNTPKHRISSTAAINYELGRSRTTLTYNGEKLTVAS
uniref:Uncharacterized protein n=1 Tax=Aegilops tauschii subsp. strangulata TaxID=200361 RepID=A0A453G4C6_AEGTS